MINPNYPSYETVEKEEPLDLTPITDALEDVKRAINSNVGQESVEITNFDEVKLHLRQELAQVVKQLKPAIEANKPVKSPTSIEVSNFPKMEKHPDSIKVTNLSELGTLLTNLIQSVESLNVNPIVNVPAPIVNIPEMLAPIVNIPPQSAPIVDINIEQLLSALQPLRLLSRDPNKPITVRMSDGRSFIDAIANTLKENGDRMATVVSTSYGLTKDEYKAASNELAITGLSDIALAKKITVSGTTTYIAQAMTGTATSAARWRVKRISVSGADTLIQWADGNSNYDNIATDLTALSYS